MQSTFPVNILIADDHWLIAEGIITLLKNEKFVGEITTVSNGREAIDEVLSKDFDFLIMDINMPVMNGIEATKLIKQKKPDVKIIILSMFNDVSVVSKALKAGADGFISKDTGKAEVLLAFEKIMTGEKYISPKLSASLFIHLNDRNKDSGSQLTPRELEVLRYIVDGNTNQEIAKKLFLSPATIDTHRKNMLAKLGLRNTASLVKYAVDNHLL